MLEHVHVFAEHTILVLLVHCVANEHPVEPYEYNFTIFINNNVINF